MIYGICAYFLFSVIVVVILNLNRKRHYKIPKARIQKNGLIFYTKKRHRICINNANYLIIGKCVYIKQKRLIMIKNVENIEQIDDFLYFSGLGVVNYCINLTNYYKYFNIAIDSKSFDVAKQKALAIEGIFSYPFCFEEDEDFERYLWIIETIFNIHVEKDKICVRQNKYNLCYTLSYKVNNKMKRIYVGDKK